jgi:hypothetical protein
MDVERGRDPGGSGAKTEGALTVCSQFQESLRHPLGPLVLPCTTRYTRNVGGGNAACDLQAGRSRVQIPPPL